MAQFIPLIILAVGAVVKAVGTVQEANAASESHKYNAKMDIASAVAENQQASAREESIRRQAAQFKGEQRAAFAQSGTGAGGSAADIMEASAARAELDAMTTRYEGNLRAWGFKASAEQERFQAQAVKRAGRMQAIGGLLSSAGSYGAMGGKMPWGGGGTPASSGAAANTAAWRAGVG